MSEKKFNCVLGKDYHIINNNVDNMSYYLQDGNDVVLVINLINRLVEENEQLQKQVKSFETTMNATSDYNAFLESKITTLEKENKELNSIKKFAEKNGINIFLINEAFRKCWKDNGKLFEENERLRNRLERKTILLKIRTKHIDDREKSFHELLNYLESFCYKSNIDGNYAKQDIINILNSWEIREYD